MRKDHFEKRGWKLKRPGEQSEKCITTGHNFASNLIVQVKSDKIFDHFSGIVESAFRGGDSMRRSNMLGC